MSSNHSAEPEILYQLYSTLRQSHLWRAVCKSSRRARDITMPPASASPEAAEQVASLPFFPHARSQMPKRPPDRRSLVTIAIQLMRARAAANVFFNQAKKERRMFL
ncbi:hypothetical protein EHI46_16865 [Rhizobium leguminosarum]|nr:hypothetical protein EHI46_16865 [Rhizobium leguminosarum]